MDEVPLCLYGPLLYQNFWIMLIVNMSYNQLNEWIVDLLYTIRRHYEV